MACVGCMYTSEIVVFGISASDAEYPPDALVISHDSNSDQKPDCLLLYFFEADPMPNLSAAKKLVNPFPFFVNGPEPVAGPTEPE
jgi:hypothetical protein